MSSPEKGFCPDIASVQNNLVAVLAAARADGADREKMRATGVEVNSQTGKASTSISPTRSFDGTTGSGGSRTRLHAMLVIFLVEAILAVYLIPRWLPEDPIARRNVMRLEAVLHRTPAPSHRPRHQGAMPADPPLGLRLQDTGAGNAIRKASDRNRWPSVVVYIGGCVSCAGADLGAWERQATARRLSMVVLTSASTDRAKAFRYDIGFKSPIVADTSGTLLKQLNATWRPRAYLFSPEGRLIWLQTTETFDLFGDDGKAIDAATKGTYHAS